MRLAPLLLATTLLAACSPRPADTPRDGPAAPTAAPAKSDVPAGAYDLDLSHTSVNFRVSHLGLSHYTARFTKVAGTLQFDPVNPAAQSVSVTIDAGSLQTNYPDPTELDFDAKVEKEFLDAAKFPTITFRWTKVEPTGAAAARVTGDLTLHAVTRPIVLDVTFNGGYPKGGMDPMGARIGFSAKGVFKRSDFGITYGIPAPGTNMGVGDEIQVAIESEFTMP